MTRAPDRRRLPAVLLLVLGLAAPVVLATPASAATRPVVRLSDGDVRAGERVVARVKRATRPRGADLLLQRRYLDRWRTVDRTAIRTRKWFVLRVPTDQYGTFTYRVVAKRGAQVVSRSAKRRLTVRPPYDPVGRARQHVFSGGRRVVRWDSCAPIRWRFNPQRSPKRGLRQVQQGVRRVEAATGLDFRYAGTTTQRPNPYGTGLRRADVIIGWRSQGYAPFRGTDTVGVGGNGYYLAAHQEADGTRVRMAVQGGVVLNAGMKDELRNGYGKGLTWGEVIIHELGHVVGLDHTAARRQIMYYRVIPRAAQWGAGDLAGLRRLGSSRGCLQPVRQNRGNPNAVRTAASSRSPLVWSPTWPVRNAIAYEPPSLHQPKLPPTPPIP
jgi:hypothetical protein